MTATAFRIPRQRTRGTPGLETVVDGFALVVATLGTLVALALLMTFSLWGVAASAAVLTGGATKWLLLRCLAVHIRLQKKIAGYSFEGTISGQHEETVWLCGGCGHMLHSATRCDGCGARIESDIQKASV